MTRTRGPSDPSAACRCTILRLLALFGAAGHWQAAAQLSCVCANGFSGLDCSADVDECGSAPCRNGATCRDSSTSPRLVTVGTYDCVCAVGFSGPKCATDINECASGPLCSDRAAPTWVWGALGASCEQTCALQPSATKCEQAALDGSAAANSAAAFFGALPVSTAQVCAGKIGGGDSNFHPSYSAEYQFDSRCYVNTDTLPTSSRLTRRSVCAGSHPSFRRLCPCAAVVTGTPPSPPPPRRAPRCIHRYRRGAGWPSAWAGVKPILPSVVFKFVPVVRAHALRCSCTCPATWSREPRAVFRCVRLKQESERVC